MEREASFRDGESRGDTHAGCIAQRDRRALPTFGSSGRSAADSSRCQRRKRGLLLRRAIVGQRGFAPALDHAPPFEKRKQTPADRLQKLGDIDISDRWQAMKRERPVLVRDEYAIEHDRMEVRVQGQIRGNTLHNGNCPALPGTDAKHFAHRAPIETEHRIDENATDCAEQFSIIRKPGTQFEWHGEDKLSERHSWQNVIHQVCRGLGHTSAQTRWTECATFAGKRPPQQASCSALQLDEAHAPIERVRHVVHRFVACW